jgi:hypothetical protein
MQLNMSIMLYNLTYVVDWRKESSRNPRIKKAAWEWTLRRLHAKGMKIAKIVIFVYHLL